MVVQNTWRLRRIWRSYLGARMIEDARTICPEQLASDIMADDMYLLYAYNIGNNV